MGVAAGPFRAVAATPPRCPRDPLGSHRVGRPGLRSPSVRRPRRSPQPPGSGLPARVPDHTAVSPRHLRARERACDARRRHRAAPPHHDAARERKSAEGLTRGHRLGSHRRLTVGRRRCRMDLRCAPRGYVPAGGRRRSGPPGTVPAQSAAPGTTDRRVGRNRVTPRMALPPRCRAASRSALREAPGPPGRRWPLDPRRPRVRRPRRASRARRRARPSRRKDRPRHLARQRRRHRARRDHPSLPVATRGCPAMSNCGSGGGGPAVTRMDRAAPAVW